MYVTHLTTELSGGAGLAALRLHRALERRHVRSRILFRKGKSRGNSEIRRAETARSLARVVRKCEEAFEERRMSSDSLFTSPSRMTKTAFRDVVGNDSPTVLHLHWISRWIDYRSFFRDVPKRLPIVWSLHDMNPVTGGCHLPGTCQGFKAECRNCPQIRPLPGDRHPARRYLQIKAEVYGGRSIHLVANSNWMLRAAEESSIGRHAQSIRLIHLGVDLEAFRPRDQEFCRSLLGVPSEKFIIAFGAADLNDANKNLKLLCNALKGSTLRDQFHLLLFGGGAPAFDLPVSATFVGWTESESLLSIVYSAADVLAMPSRFESLGMTALEALACGTPAIVSRTGGLTDIVQDGENGYALPVDDAEAFRNTLERVASDPQVRQSLQDRARDSIAERFCWDQTADAYLSLYQEIVGEIA